MALSDGLLHHLPHHFDGASEVEPFAWAHVQLQGDGIQFFLAVFRQVGAFGQVLANQAIDVLVAGALPRAMRVAKVDGNPSILSDACMPGHLPPLVVGNAFTHCQRHTVERCTEPLHRRGRRRIVHLYQH